MIGLPSDFLVSFEEQVIVAIYHFCVAIIFFTIFTVDVSLKVTINFICFLPATFDSNVQFNIVITNARKVRVFYLKIP